MDFAVVIDESHVLALFVRIGFLHRLGEDCTSELVESDYVRWNEGYNGATVLEVHGGNDVKVFRAFPAGTLYNLNPA